MKKYIKLVWLVITKPHLFRPALMVNKAVINGSVTADVIITHSDGSSRIVEYRLINRGRSNA